MDMMTGYDKPLCGEVETTNAVSLPSVGVVGKVVTTLSVFGKRHESSEIKGREKIER